MSGPTAGSVVGGVLIGLVFLLLCFGFFLLLRWVMLWYWRVNEAVALLASIREELHALNSRQRTAP